MDCDSTAVKSTTKSFTTFIGEPFSMSSDSAVKLFNVICAGSLLVLYNVTVQLLRLKYVGNEQTPFETHEFLMNTSIIAFVTAAISSVIMFYDYLPFMNRKPFSPTVSSVLRIVVFFSGVLAHLSLLMVLIAG